MRKILLYNNDLTTNTVIGGNVDVDKWKFCVRDAQASKLEEILGEKLYDKIESRFSSASAFPEGDYKKLYDDYINPFLIHQAAVEYLQVGAYRIVNTGMTKPAPANAQAVDAEDIKALVSNQSYKAEMYQGRLERYLCKSRPPEYRYDSESIVNPMNQNGLTGGLYFGD